MVTPTPTYGLTHLAISVKDIERTLSFYCSVFDMQMMYHEKDMIQLTTPGCHDILVFSSNGMRKRVRREALLILVSG